MQHLSSHNTEGYITFTFIKPTSDGIQLYLLTYFHYEKGFVPQSLAPQMIMGGSGE